MINIVAVVQSVSQSQPHRPQVRQGLMQPFRHQTTGDRRQLTSSMALRERKKTDESSTMSSSPAYFQQAASRPSPIYLPLSTYA